MKVKSYSINEIFEKKLLFLIPFYIFTYEADFKDINDDTSRLDALKAEYRSIADRLEKLVTENEIDQYDKSAIMAMSEKVMTNLAQHYENIVEGVGTIMGGQVLDYEAKRIKNESRLDTLIDLVKKGLLSLASAAKEAGMTEDAFAKKMKTV